MTRKEWEEEAERLELLAQDYDEQDDESMRDYSLLRAQACREAACYGEEERE